MEGIICVLYNMTFCASSKSPKKEEGVVTVGEDGKTEKRVEVALTCLPQCDPATHWNNDHLASSFRRQLWAPHLQIESA
ncbi:hypothetical protein Tsubulata_036323 [Turnera subulata]|uniref:Uncharacterized protein n=1 Tax=Turnera subulata TaxID=218843 RepID=A0A9Q0FGM3_9ROSI|nr:hypothetical protein Tsubulata_036323 [Turnera subulata]